MKNGTELNAREEAYRRKAIIKTAGEYLIDPDEDYPTQTDLYDSYMVLKAIKDEDKNIFCASEFVNVVERFDHLSVEEMLDSIESSLPVECEDMPKFMQDIDWKLLREQKLTLLQVITYLETNKLPAAFTDALDGIIHLLDGLQDAAVDTYGLEEEQVFGVDLLEQEFNTPEQD